MTVAQRCADHYAQEACEKHFQDRRGVWHIENIDCLLLYNNHPYAVDLTRRPDEMKRIESRLKTIGIDVLARGGSKNLIDGSEEPYSISLLLDSGSDRLEEVLSIAIEEAVRTATKNPAKNQGVVA